MSGYIGKVHITGEDPVLVGSTLYGICNSQANSTTKTVISTDNNSGKFINNNYNQLLQGTTIHVKFVNGNTVDSGLTLQVGTLDTAQNIVGNCVCSAGTIIGFTLDENEYWVVNDNVDNDTTYTFATGSTNGTISVTPTGGTAQSVSVYGLQDGAYRGVITDIGANTSSTDLPTTAAVAQYVQAQTGGLSGLTGAMHFRGTSTVEIHDGDDSSVDPTITGYTFNGNGDNAGDVVLWNGKEFVWTGTTWELLGDEGSYALKSSTDVITEVSNFTTNTLPTLTPVSTTASSVSVTNGSAASLTTNNVNIPNVSAAGSATTASVAAGILNITIGTPPTIEATPITVKEVNVFTANTPTAVTSTPVTFDAVSNWSAGSQAVLNTNDTTVVVPIAPNP